MVVKPLFAIPLDWEKRQIQPANLFLSFLKLPEDQKKQVLLLCQDGNKPFGARLEVTTTTAL